MYCIILYFVIVTIRRYINIIILVLTTAHSLIEYCKYKFFSCLLWEGREG